MARSRPKNGVGCTIIKHLTVFQRILNAKTGEIVNYALVGLNVRKTRFKSRMAKPVFGHLFKKTKLPFFPETIYRRFVFGDITEYGANVAKISKVHLC